SGDNKIQQVLSKEDFLELKMTYCKDWNKDDTKIFKGIYRNYSEYNYINPTIIERKSANTSNISTLLFDNSPYNINYPKRSKSLICTSNYNRATLYGDVYRVIPFDGAKIAVCPDYDFWYSFRKISINYDNIGKFNDLISLSYGSKFINQLNDTNYNIFIKQLQDLCDKLKIDNKYNLPTDINDYFKLFDAKSNDINLYDYKEYAKLDLENNEVWTDSKCLLYRNEY
ncbi:hypothetical protein M0Q97_08330, partial [Candidatus Dojkabacteria bacterium]|nr:hypothetical protein [Candidatus Dojkabacteria bacterium]